MHRPKIGKTHTLVRFQNDEIDGLRFVAHADGGGIDPFSSKGHRDKVAALPPARDITYAVPPPGNWRADWAHLQREGWTTLAEAIKTGRVAPDFDPSP